MTQDTRESGWTQSTVEINALCERLIAFRDMFPPTQRAERDLLADVCNALDGYTKLTREHAALLLAKGQTP